MSDCSTCDGDGYTETWNDDQSGVIVTLCPDCDGTGNSVALEVRNYRERVENFTSHSQPKERT